MDRQGKNIIIIGAGIVGLSCALSLQRKGHGVTIIDPRGFAGGASSGNAGVLAVSECVPIGTPELLRQIPSLILKRNSPLTIHWPYTPRMASWLYRFLRSCAPSRLIPAMASLATLLARANQFHEDLAALCGNAHFISRLGWLKVFETDSAYAAAKVNFERMKGYGVDCEYLDGEAIHSRQPNLNNIFRHGVLHPECQQIQDPEGYVRAYGQEFVRRGGELIRAEVADFDCKGGVVKAARSQTDRYEGDAFVIAAGAWSAKLSKDVGTKVQLDTERGYHIVLASPRDRLASSPILWSEKSIVMSPSDDGLRITSSVEFAGLNRKANFRKLCRSIPDVRRAHVRAPGHVKSEWLGFRPSTPDSLPIIGRATSAENVFLAFGHGHLGLTLGPITGALIADLIDGRQPDIDLSPFAPGRFTSGTV